MRKSDKITKKTNLKKDLRLHVSESLQSMFKDFESAVGKRKFKKNIKKASKVLITSVKPEKLKSSMTPGEASGGRHNGVVPTSVSRVMAEN